MTKIETVTYNNKSLHTYIKYQYVSFDNFKALACMQDVYQRPYYLEVNLNFFSGQQQRKGK